MKNILYIIIFFGVLQLPFMLNAQFVDVGYLGNQTYCLVCPDTGTCFTTDYTYSNCTLCGYRAHIYREQPCCNVNSNGFSSATYLANLAYPPINGFCVVGDSVVYACTDENGIGKATLTNNEFNSGCWDVHMPVIDNDNYFDIYAVTDKRIIACSEYGRIGITKDASNTWEIDSNVRAGDWLISIDFADAQVGYITGVHGLLLKTTDGAETWTEKTIPTDYINDVSCVNRDTVLVCTTSGRVFRTTNGGDNWSLVLSTSSVAFYAVDFLPSGIGYAAGSSSVFRSSDFGATWYRVHKFTSNTKVITNIDAVTDSVAFFVTYNGAIYKTNNAGGAGFLTDMLEPNEDVALVYPNPFTGIVKIQAPEKISDVEVLNLLGERVYSQYDNLESGSVNLSMLSSGAYFIRINTGEHSYTSKLYKH